MADHIRQWYACVMETPLSPFTAETEMLVQQHGGPLSLAGEPGNYVVMRADVYDAMLGMVTDEEAETLASIRRGLADVRAGRTHDPETSFRRLSSRYDS
jgi:PHD/YefM family antitoxin component YafN of YafNO toxin-antitoxin module